MTKREFLRQGNQIEKEPLLYTMGGLDEIYLLNGFERKSTPYGEGVTISDIDGLHKAIGLSMIQDRKTLTPKELRFLRKEMGMSQAELGRALRLSSQQVARWEKGECEISGPAEMLIRVLYALELVPSRERGAFLNKLLAKLNQLSKTDEIRPTKLVFEETDAGWAKTLFKAPVPMMACAI